MMKKIYASIDIGSDTIKLVVGELFNGKVNVLASNCVRSKGIRKGLIVDANLAISAIRDGISGISEELGIDIKKVIVSVPSYNAKFIYVTNGITIDREDEVINSDDVNRVIRDSVYGRIPDDYELVTVIPVSFSIDDGEAISRPVGKIGHKLTMRGIMVTTPKRNVYSVVSVMEALGLEIVDIALSSLGDYFEVRNSNLDKKVGAVINIGHETTTVSVFNRGKLMNTEVIQVGGYNVERDISYIFGISIFDARTLKEKFASSHKRFTQLSDTYEVVNLNNEKVKLNQLEVTEVVMSRISQILRLAKKQALLLTKQDIGYLVITGGLTEIKSFKNLAFEILEKDAIIYKEETLGVRDNKYTTSLGLIKYFCDKMDVRGRDYSMVSDEDALTLSTPSKIKNKTSKKDSSNFAKIFNNFTKSGKEE